MVGNWGATPPASNITTRFGACVRWASMAAAHGSPVPTATVLPSSNSRAAQQIISSIDVNGMASSVERGRPARIVPEVRPRWPRSQEKNRSDADERGLRPYSFWIRNGSQHPGRIVSTAAPATAVIRPRVNGWFLATIILIHVLALAAFVPYAFAWWGIPLVLAGNFLFGSIGINLGYHRMLTHKAASFPRWLERFFVLCGVCSLEGSPLWWVCMHRMHHQHSDEDGDPHSPKENFFWGHMEW